jgi:predicted PolB exonuclease-like 3'-5' exonuclease
MHTTEPALTAHPSLNAGPRTAFLVVDTESVPDGRLLGQVKYPGDCLSAEDAITKAQDEARQASSTGSDFLPVCFQTPIAVCVVRVASDFSIQNVSCLDAPQFRPAEIVRKFWVGVEMYQRVKLVTFNGRGFDMPLLELAAFRYGLSLRDYCQSSRNRFGGNHVDLLDWITNFGACRLPGGLNLLAKMLGKPGKTEVSGDQVHRMYREGRLQEINDYCLCDTLDTYFVFLRTRVVTGEITTDQEQELVKTARDYLEGKTGEIPALRAYLDAWSEQVV